MCLSLAHSFFHDMQEHYVKIHEHAFKHHILKCISVYIYNAKLRCVQKRGTMGPLFDTFLPKIWHCSLNPKACHDMNIAMDVAHDHPEF